jgi:hypothetical protein
MMKRKEKEDNDGMKMILMLISELSQSAGWDKVSSLTFGCSNKIRIKIW